MSFQFESSMPTYGKYQCIKFELEKTGKTLSCDDEAKPEYLRVVNERCNSMCEDLSRYVSRRIQVLSEPGSFQSIIHQSVKNGLSGWIKVYALIIT